MLKFIVLCTLFVAAAAAHQFGGSGFDSERQTFGAATSDDVHAEVKSFSAAVRTDVYKYAFDTTNRITAAASGDAYGNVHGNFGWVSPEGVHVAIQYVADENGYQPSGDVLPTPHPIPAAILRSLEYIRTHPRQEDRGNLGGHY